jgi:hypothetical protein
MPIGHPNPNTQLIYYSEWMAATYSRIYSRSAELQKIDEALKFAENNTSSFESMQRWYADLGSARRSESARIALALDQKLRDLSIIKVRDAFNRFALSKSDWRASNRNGEGAVTKLAAQLAHLTSRLPPTEQAAVLFIETERNKSIPALFNDCKVFNYSDKITTLKQKKDAAATALHLRTVYTDANSAGMGAPTTVDAENLLRSIGSEVETWVHDAFFGPSHGGHNHNLLDFDLKAILEEAIHAIKAELAAILPIVGLAVASVTFVFHTVNLVMQSIVVDSLIDLERTLSISDSRAALTSLKEWQAIAITKTASNVVRSGVNVAAHSAAIASCGFGAGAQLAVSIANAILALAAVIGEMGQQYRQKKALEAWLVKRDLGREIFAKSYLATAYYLLNTPDSHIALQLVRIGGPGWQADVERLKKDGDLKTIIETSANIIDQSKYRIRKSDTSKLRETVGVTAVSKLKDKLKGPVTISQ